MVLHFQQLQAYTDTGYIFCVKILLRMYDWILLPVWTQSINSEGQTEAEVKFHSSGITILIPYFVCSCGFMMPLIGIFVSDASTPPLPSPALTLSGQLSKSAEAQLMKR